MLGISTIDFWYTNGYSAGLGLIRITTERFVKTIFTTCMRRVHWENAVGLTSPVLCYVDEGGFPVLIEYPLVLLSEEAMDVKGLSLHQIGTNLTCLLKPNYHKIAPSCASQALLVDKERKQVLMKSRIIKLEAVDTQTGIPNLEHVLQVPQLLLCHQARPAGGVEGARVTQLPSFKLMLKDLRARNAAVTLHTSSLERLVKSQAKDLLALLQERSPSTEGIFLLGTSDHASQEIREALDRGVVVQLQSQPVHLLSIILKDFLRKIPSQLLQTQLCQQCMDALQKPSRQERLAGLKDFLQDSLNRIVRILRADRNLKRRPAGGVEGARVTQLPSFKLTLKELGARNAAVTLHTSSLERLVKSQAKVRIIWGAISAILTCHIWHWGPFQLQGCLAPVRSLQPGWHSAPAHPGPAGSPAGAWLIHGGDLPTATSDHASQEIREALDSGMEVQLQSQPVHLLAIILKDFLHKIPSQLLQTQLYQQCMDTLQKPSRQERLAGLKEREASSSIVLAQGPLSHFGHGQEGSKAEETAVVRPAGGVEGAQVTQLPSFKLMLKELGARNAAMILHTSSPERLVKSQAKDLLALPQEHGSSMEGIFLLVASERASREIREALDREVVVQLQSQPVHLLAIILKVRGVIVFICSLSSQQRRPAKLKDFALGVLPFKNFTEITE
ncbi:hypothetical protein Q9966_014639 [Columba livia]|nr:hypothetical protein Q9966_014639 [Columba livia]